MIAVNIMTTNQPRLGVEDTALDALRRVIEEDAPHIPVLAVDGVVAGLVTPSRLMGTVLANAPEMDQEHKSFRKTLGALEQRPVRTVMDTKLVTVSPQTPASEIAVLFDPPASAAVVLVVDDQKRFLGLISPRGLSERLCKYKELKEGTPE